MNYFEQDNMLPKFTYPFCMNQNTYSTTNNVDYSNLQNNENTLTRTLANDINKSYECRLSRANKLDESLEMIKKSVSDELNDELFYSTILNQALTDEEKNIISDIKNDEIKHNKLLRNVYYDLTNITLPEAKNVNELEPLTYTENLKKALMGETAAISKYRKILNDMTDRRNYDILMEIMTDEIRHACKYNYLISLNFMNKLSNNESNNNNFSEKQIS